MEYEEWKEIGLAIKNKDEDKANELLDKFINRRIEEGLADELEPLYSGC
jgi:hypothetical protein